MLVWVLVVAIVATLVLLTAEARRRAGLYWYEVEADYQYAFSDAHVVPVEIASNGVELPELEGTWDTALLPIRVKSKMAASWLEPWIEIYCGSGGRVRQYFERRAEGKRYLNLSCAVGVGVEAEQFVELRGHHIDWSVESSELLTFRVAPFEDRRILVVAPHPDDAEIAAFGLYAGRESFIVTVSAGNYADRRFEHLFDDPRDQELVTGRLRTWDSIVVPMWGGVPPSHAINLGYFNGSLRAMYRVRDKIVADDQLATDDIGIFRGLNVSNLLEGRDPRSSWKSLVEDLAQLVRQGEPEIIVTPHPVLDRSWDHRFSTLALLEALSRVANTDRQLFLYSNHHVGTEYFPFGPDDGVVTLGPWFDEELPLQSVYSFPVSDKLQIEKLFALDAMHDLRPVPRRRSSDPRRRTVERIRELSTEIWRDPVDSYNYYRRALRPNELFFTYTAEDLDALVAYVERDILSEIEY